MSSHRVSLVCGNPMGSGAIGPHCSEKIRSEAAHHSLSRWKELGGEQDLPATCCGLRQPRTSQRRERHPCVPADGTYRDGSKTKARQRPAPAIAWPRWREGRAEDDAQGREEEGCARQVCLETYRPEIHPIPAKRQLSLHA